MATIQWRPEVNPLTTPQSWRARFVPRNAAGKEDIAADIALRHPNFSKADILTILTAEDEAIKARLLNGEQVTKEGSFSWYISFTGRLNSSAAPLPPLDDCLQVNVRVSQPFIAAIRQKAQTERLPPETKMPVINTAKDRVLGLNNVLNPAGALQLMGENLAFDRIASDESGCLIEGTRNGKAVQRRFFHIGQREILLVPDIPAQANAWNNEYKVSVSARYSERGTLRTGNYSRMLRTPLRVDGFGSETGILTGRAGSPYVSITGGSASASETLRVQAIFDVRANALRFNLLDMQEGGRTGAVVSVAANGEHTLQGFADSAVTSMTLRINNFAALKEIVRNDYTGRLIDILIVTTA